MKLAITSDGSDLSSRVAARFGRARYFIIYDVDSGEMEAVDNVQNLEALQGAGIQAAQNIVELGVDAAITGNVGPRAFATLQAGAVKIYIGATGSVSDATEQFKAGKLECVTKANVEEHWV